MPERFPATLAREVTARQAAVTSLFDASRKSLKWRAGQQNLLLISTTGGAAKPTTSYFEIVEYSFDVGFYAGRLYGLFAASVVPLSPSYPHRSRRSAAP
jgi:hypothetical protein